VEVQTESANRLGGHLEIKEEKKKGKAMGGKKRKKKAKNVKEKKTTYKCPSPAWIQVGEWEISVLPLSSRYRKKKEQWGEAGGKKDKGGGEEEISKKTHKKTQTTPNPHTLRLHGLIPTRHAGASARHTYETTWDSDRSLLNTHTQKEG
jgi:hypothetical protein